MMLQTLKNKFAHLRNLPFLSWQGARIPSQSPASSLASQPIRWGVTIICIFFGLFGIWAIVAPINSASVAPGMVVVSGNKKTIQHLEGGIIEEIFVQEGQTVKQGDLLMQLSQQAILTSLNIVKQQLTTYYAAEKRLISERDRVLMTTTTPSHLSSIDWPLWEEVIQREKHIFQTRWDEMAIRFDIMEKKVKQAENEKEGLMAKEKSALTQLELAREELAANQKLFKAGIIAKPELMQSQQRLAELEGNQGDYQARVAQINQMIAEEKLKILDLEKQWTQEATTLLQETQGKIMELEEQRSHLESILKRTSIAAPVSGVVTGLKFHTLGGVIHAGEPILTIVPQDDELLIEAQINPVDIDMVAPGLEANVVLNAYKSRYLPKLKGQVTLVSADAFVEESGRSFYLARIALDEKELEKLGDISLYPGMPATVFVITGSRTFLSYLLDPISNSFNKAFREE